MRNQWKYRADASGLHMFDRITGLNILLDEVRVAEVQWATAPRQVSVALTNVCDLSCSFCFAPKARAELPYQMLTQWLEELDAGGCLGVGFGGGEPTLYPRLVDLCRHTAERTRLAVTLTTHGHTFDASLARALKGSVNFIRVSMDGVGATYEGLRSRSFAEFLRHLAFVREAAPFGINYLVNDQTLPDLNAGIEVAEEQGAVAFLLLPEQPLGSSPGPGAWSGQRLRSWVESYRGAVPLAVSEMASNGLPTCSPFARGDGLVAYAHVDAGGILKRTSFEADGVVIGNRGIRQALEELRSLGEVLSK